MDDQLKQWLRKVQRRLRRLRCWRWLAVIGILAGVTAAIALRKADGSPWIGPPIGWALAALMLLSVLLIFVVSARSFRDLMEVARRVEHHFPNLNQRLLAALAGQPPTADQRPGFLQTILIRETRRHGLVHDWQQLVPTSRLFWLRAAACVSLLVAGWLTFRLIQTPGGLTASVQQGRQQQRQEPQIQVEPGDTQLERGTNLVVVARFSGSVPSQVILVLQHPDGEELRQPMKRRLEDPLFAVTISDVQQELAYRVHFDDLQSDNYRVRIFEYPDVVQVDAQLTFPDYTGLPEREILDARRVTAVEGSQLAWTLHVNKPLASAALETDQGQTLPLEADPTDPLKYRATVTLQEDRRWKLRLQDAEGRPNRAEHELFAKVTPNRPAELKLTAARDLRVSPLEELKVQAAVQDDYGVRSYGITYARPGESAHELVLGEQAPASQPLSVDHVLDFEAMQAQPDQLLAYYFWAEDLDAQGQVRRSLSDQFFAEVRHFEEIFRQGQSPAGGESPSGQSPSSGEEAAAQLVELQRQIITATWNLIRRESAQSPSANLVDDVQVLVESQQTALENASQLSQSVEDVQSATHLNEVRQFMLQALQHLSAAAAPAVDSLQPALSAEQASYQGLLRLQAREHEVTRSQNRSNSAGSAASRRLQQQLQQLQLSDDANRYETQRQAQAQQDQPQQELKRTLNRLRDLARRQQDVNRQLQQQQTALQEQASPEQRDEVQRQLKRLRDQQQQLLRDADELQEELADADSQPELQSTRQQLQDSRQRLQQSSQALAEGDVAQALSQGTRVERELRQIGDRLRQQAADRFDEDLRQMRQQARQLDQRQQELSRQLDDSSTSPQPGLRNPAGEQVVREALTQQHTDLEQLLQQMQTTIEAAESPEPLLAEKLYEGFREARQRQISESLQAVGELLQQGLREEAARREDSATQGIEQLRGRVEQAAESILGDETEALRRAVGELDELAQQLNDELNRAERSADDSSQDPNGQPPQSGQLARSTDQSAQDARPSADPSNPRAEGANRSSDAMDGSPRAGRTTSDRPSGSTPSGSGDPGANRTDDRRDGGGGLLQSFADSLGTGPITGDQYRQWTDRLRDVENMIDDPQLRAQAARIRDRARGFRHDLQRHSKEPQWPLIRELVAQPLEELRQQVGELLLRRSARRDALVPVDRDPVPEEFAERVRRYYEQLGQGP